MRYGFSDTFGYDVYVPLVTERLVDQSTKLVEVIIGNEVVSREKVPNTIEAEDEVEVEVEVPMTEGRREFINDHNEDDESRINRKKKKSSKGKIWKKYRNNIDGRKIKNKNKVKSEKTSNCSEMNHTNEHNIRKDEDTERNEEEEDEAEDGLYNGDHNDVHRYVRYSILFLFVFFLFLCVKLLF